MTQEQLNRLDSLNAQKGWTLKELMEIESLQKLFYKTFRPIVDVRDLSALLSNEKY